MVEGDGLQVAQGRVARAEVVQRQAEAGTLERDQNIGRRCVAIEPLTLRYFEHHLLGRDAEGSRHRGRLLRHAVPQELPEGDIHAQRQA